MKPTSIQSKSFIFLTSLAIVGTALVVFYTTRHGENRVQKNDVEITAYKPTDKSTPVSQKPAVVVNTSNWKEYTDKQYGFSFRYNPEWKIKSPSTNKDGYYVLEIDPGTRYDNMKIYVSPTNYYVMDGLPTEPTVLGTSTVSAISVHDLLFGIKRSRNYYTFDLGASLSLQPYFKAMVDSAKFSE